MRVAYDLGKNLPCFDVYNMLMGAEHDRVRRGEDYVDVEIIPGTQNGFGRKDLWPHGEVARRSAMRCIVLPMCRMLPSVRKVSYVGDASSASEGIKRSTHTFGSFVRAYSAGIRPLRCPPDVPRCDNLVVITLREASHWPTRNSKVGEWIAAARKLQERGWRVVVVRDTLMARTQIVGLEISAAAAVDLASRARLYRAARCVAGVNNGPVWFSMALDAPTLMLRPGTEDAAKSAREESLRYYGIGDDGMPGAPPHQRLRWRDDVEQNILEEVDSFMEASSARLAS